MNDLTSHDFEWLEGYFGRNHGQIYTVGGVDPYHKEQQMDKVWHTWKPDCKTSVSIMRAAQGSRDTEDVFYIGVPAGPLAANQYPLLQATANHLCEWLDEQANAPVWGPAEIKDEDE
jgi:hypothetical protein